MHTGAVCIDCEGPAKFSYRGLHYCEKHFFEETRKSILCKHRWMDIDGDKAICEDDCGCLLQKVGDEDGWGWERV